MAATHDSQPDEAEAEPRAQMWAEYDPASAPQVAVGKEPEVVQPIVPDGASQYQRSTGGVVAETKTDEFRDSAQRRWIRLGNFGKRHWLAVTMVAIVIVALAIALPLGLGMAPKSGVGLRDADGDGDGSSIQPTPGTKTSASPTAVLPDATATYDAESECVDEKYEALEFVGLVDMDYNVTTTRASTTDECCTLCYQGQDCAGWHVKKEASGIIWCDLLDQNYDADGKDKKCTKGHPRVTRAGSSKTDYAGFGPCAMNGHEQLGS